MATYATIEELQAWVRLEADDEIDTDQLQIALDAASRQIDSWCGWQFSQDALPVTARTYSAADPGVYFVGLHLMYLPDPISTDTGFVLATGSATNSYATTWSATDYRLEPANGVQSGVPGWAYHRIRAVAGRRFDPRSEPTVQITARFGWPAVPEAVKQACLIQAVKLHERRTARGGLIAFGADGGSRSVMMLDADARALLAPYKRPSPHGI